MTRMIEAIDYHIAGEVLRILPGWRDIPGETMAQKATAAKALLLAERAIATQEPRGHADIFAAFLTPPVTEGADFGALICDGILESAFKGTCGHGSIALAAAALEQGWVTAEPGTVSVTIDMPAGPVTLAVEWDGKHAGDVIYSHVPSRVAERAVILGTIHGDLVAAGPLVFLADAESAGLKADPAEAFRAYRQIIAAAPSEKMPDLVQLRWPDESGFRSITFFGPAGLDRSPCGTASSALATLLAETAKNHGQWFTNTTLMGSCFEARLDTMTGLPQIRARAWLTARSTLILAKDDPLHLGLAVPLLFQAEQG